MSGLNMSITSSTALMSRSSRSLHPANVDRLPLVMPANMRFTTLNGVRPTI